MASMRPLVVEDDSQLVEVVVDLLSQRGYVVAGRARNLTDALQLTANIVFDCAVLKKAAAKKGNAAKAVKKAARKAAKK